MNLIERVFALKRLPCFRSQTDYDLARIAETAQEKIYGPLEPICTAGRILRRVYITAQGAIETGDGNPAPELIGVESVLLNLPVRNELRAAPQGAHCMLLEKSVFFTIVYQCPSIIQEILATHCFERPAQRDKENEQ